MPLVILCEIIDVESELEVFRYFLDQQQRLYTEFERNVMGRHPDAGFRQSDTTSHLLSCWEVCDRKVW